jgi:hypothetical protein
MTTINKIHPEAMNHIASFVGPSDWNNFRQVNQTAHKAMNHLPKDMTVVITFNSDDDLKRIDKVAGHGIRVVVDLGKNITFETYLKLNPYKGKITVKNHQAHVARFAMQELNNLLHGLF